VNNAAYTSFVEKVARAHAESIGLTFAAMRDFGGAFVVRKHEAVYFREAREGDRILLKTWIESFSGPKCSRKVEVFLRSQCIFAATTEWVWIDLVRRLPRRVPHEIIAGFETGSIQASP
jgi:acyl-CoA thioester hydrolase